MLRIEKHRLVGDQVTHRDTPNRGGPLAPRYLVFHYTAGSSAASAVNSLCTRKPSGNASAHIVLGRDGAIVQLAPFDVVTWHAGLSQWNGLIGLNNWSIGIEMDNAGPMNRVGSKYVAWFGRAYPDSEVMLAEHKHGGGVRPWHAYTEAQIARALELAEVLVAHYGLEDVIGHEDIAPARKQDPGPAFPLSAVRSRALGREADAPEKFAVTATSLNIRKGPGASYETVAPALKKGTVLVLVESGERWSKVEVDGPTDVEGWVSNAFIERLADAPRVLAQAEAPGPRSLRSTSRAPGAAATARKRSADKQSPTARRTPKTRERSR